MHNGDHYMLVCRHSSFLNYISAVTSGVQEYSNLSLLSFYAFDEQSMQCVRGILITCMYGICM